MSPIIQNSSARHYLTLGVIIIIIIIIIIITDLYSAFRSEDTEALEKQCKIET